MPSYQGLLAGSLSDVHSVQYWGTSPTTNRRFLEPYSTMPKARKGS